MDVETHVLFDVSVSLFNCWIPDKPHIFVPSFRKKCFSLQPKTNKNDLFFLDAVC